MGIILSRFRTKSTTKELLEKIQQEIQSIEDYNWSTTRRQKNIVENLFYGSILIYAILGGIFFFVYLAKCTNVRTSCWYASPLVIFPVLVYLLFRYLKWYYKWVLDSKDDTLKELRREKKKILEKVQETETYKVAKELLEKYDPSALRDLNPRSQPPSPGLKTPIRPNMGEAELRHRRQTIGAPQQNFNSSFAATPSNAGNVTMTPGLNRTLLPNQRFQPNTPQTGLMPIAPLRPPPRLSLSRPILAQDRNVVEKLVDYVVGDGPSNRYALICNACKSHNGMALKDEFEYIAFRCCYCGFFNPARKERPFAPRLPAALALPPLVDEPESDSEKPTKNSDSASSVEITDISSPKPMASSEVGQPSDTRVESENEEEKVTSKKVLTDEDQEKEEQSEEKSSFLSEDLTKEALDDIEFIDNAELDNAELIK
ncbi:Endoplasmic reticulum junction formation protein lunapark [Halotydeus destructor]|nr:Endoplasmic reticulum junction formation protein lunapark [Halotydeus destructor]